MKKFLLTLFALSALSLGAFGQVTKYSVGSVVSNFTVTDVHGNVHTLYDITAAGKYVYLDFFFDTCPPCQATSPIFGDFYNKYGCNGGEVYCLGINNGSDNDAMVIAYEEKYGGSGNHIPSASSQGGSGAVNDAFGVGAYPTYCLIGPDNKLINKDIYPIANVGTFEATFSGAFNPAPMACSLGLSEEKANAELRIYPNPASSVTQLQFTSTKESKAEITVSNILGQVVMSTEALTQAGNNNIELDLQTIEAGHYLIQIRLNSALITSKLKVIN